MFTEKYNVWIEAEQWVEGEWDIRNGNTDVIVEFDNKKRWVASFFTYSNISELVEKNKTTGECLNGKYFWASDMILVDEISSKRIQEIIRFLINEDKFESIFKILTEE